jgi:hypothetical protein
MSKTSDHFHKLSHDHHAGKISTHEQAIAAHKAAMDAEEEGTSQHAFHKAMVSHHEHIVAQHEPLRVFHKNMMEKTTSDEMNKGAMPASIEEYVRAVVMKTLDTVMPTAVSAVTPNRPGIVAVPRAGQQPVEKPNVPEQFAHLIKVEDGEQEPRVL